MENTEKTVTVCDVQFRTGTKVYYFDPSGLNVRSGDDVIIETSRGPEFGKCVTGNHEVNVKDTVSPLRAVLRLATAQDRRIDAENREKEKRAHDICMKKIAELKLEMQLVSTEYAFDGSKILFFFTADGRVDFRELVKTLASILRTRIELRQIGVRDKAKMVGGLGICGRPFCCREFLSDFQAVSIKMAKTQNLSLNPTKISGTCGRLMCCLNYEQEAYEDLRRTSPKPESLVDTPDGRGIVTDVNLLRQSVNIRLESQPETTVCHRNCDICVLRNGKAKKGDEPIPDDLAPISGGKKNRSEKVEFTTYLDPVVIRRSDEILEPAVLGGEDTAKSKRRNRRGKKPEAEHSEPQPEAQKAAKHSAEKKQKQKPSAPKKQTPEEKSAKKQAEPRPKKQDAPVEAASSEEKAPRKQRNNYRRYHKQHKNKSPKSEA